MGIGRNFCNERLGIMDWRFIRRARYRGKRIKHCRPVENRWTQNKMRYKGRRKRKNIAAQNTVQTGIIARTGPMLRVFPRNHVNRTRQTDGFETKIVILSNTCVYKCLVKISVHTIQSARERETKTNGHVNYVYVNTYVRVREPDDEIIWCTVCLGGNGVLFRSDRERD